MQQDTALLSADWAAISKGLREAGYTPHQMPAGVVVTLPLQASVTAEASPSGLKLEAKFGKVGRLEASGITIAIVLMCLFWTLFGNGGRYFFLLVPAVAAWDGYRWASTQRAINCIRRLYESSGSEA
jgi:hypothetical protein